MWKTYMKVTRRYVFEYVSACSKKEMFNLSAIDETDYVTINFAQKVRKQIGRNTIQYESDFTFL